MVLAVQAHGWINQRAFYFRSRYTKSVIEIANEKNCNKIPYLMCNNEVSRHVLQTYEKPYEASWISHEEAERLIVEFSKGVT